MHRFQVTTVSCLSPVCSFLLFPFLRSQHYLSIQANQSVENFSSLTDSSPFFDSPVSAPEPQVDNARATLSQSYPNDHRFTEIDDQTTVPPSINSTLDPNSNPLFAANPGASGAEVLANWVLSGYAGNSNGTTIEGDSPSASSLSISPGYVVEQSSSPDTNASLPGNLVPPTSTTGYVDRRASFISPLENADSFSSPLDSNGADISFPVSTLTNLAQSYGSSNYQSLNGTGNNYANGNGMLPLETSSRDSITPRNSSNDQNGGGGSADRMGWSTYSTWKSHTGVSGESNGVNSLSS